LLNFSISNKPTHLFYLNEDISNHLSPTSFQANITYLFLKTDSYSSLKSTIGQKLGRAGRGQKPYSRTTSHIQQINSHIPGKWHRSFVSLNVLSKPFNRTVTGTHPLLGHFTAQ